MSDFARQETNVVRPDVSGSARCPHFEVVAEETLRRLFSKVAAVRSEDYELFQFTHRPMEVFRGTSADGEVWHEDQIYQEFSEDRIRNFAVVIEGEVGTGKSELCAYLSHRLRRDGRPMLHIDKDDDLMSILSESIPEFYEDHFDEELPGASDFQNLRNDIVDIPQAVANNATSGAILTLRRRGYDVAPGSEQEDDIRDYVAEKLQRLVERGKYAQKIQFVGENEYKQRDELQVFDNNVPVQEAVEAWNETLWREIRGRYDTASLGDVLEEVGQKFEDTRPVIVFEDFSIAAMEAEKLRNYMERDKSADNWDFIVAGTRDSTAVLHTQTAEDRFEFFQTNEQESNSVLFLDEDSAVDFLRPYLGYIKAHDGSVRYARDTDDGTFDLKPAPEGSICAQCGFCEESFRDLFPFNQPFLRRIYAGLDDSQQSPREFIMEVFKLLRTFHDGFVDAPSSAETLRTLENTVSVADAVYEDAEAYADLAKWYGVPKNGEVVVDRMFVDAFGFPIEGLPDEIEIGDEGIRIASTGGGSSDRCPECGAHAWATDADGNRVCSNCGYGTGGGGGKSPLEREIDEQKARVDSWVEDPDKYPETDQYVRIALRDLIEELTDGFRLIEGTPLHYNLSSQKSPYVYPDTNEAPDEDQIVLDRDDFRRSDLRRLVEYGVRLDKDARTADTDAQVEASGTQLTGYAEEWRERIFTTQLENDDVFYKGHVDYDFTDFVLATYATLTLLDDPWSEITAERLNERYQSDAEFTLGRELFDGFQDTLDHGKVQAAESAMDNAEYVERTLGSLLGVSASTLDVPTVRERLDRCPPYRALKMLGREYIDNIEFRVRFTNDHLVKDLADTMYDVRGAVKDLSDHAYRSDTVEYVTDALAETDLERVSNRYQKLKTYDNMDPDLAEQLGQVCRYTQENLDIVVEAARLATELDSGGLFEQITATLASIKLDNEPLVSEFKAVPLAGTSGPDQLGKEFTEVSRYYVD